MSLVDRVEQKVIEKRALTLRRKLPIQVKEQESNGSEEEDSVSYISILAIQSDANINF